MKKVNIRESLGVGWKLFTKRPWYLLGIALSIAVLFVFTASNNAAATALSYIVYGGYLALLLKHYNQEHVVFDDLFSGLDRRWISFAFLGLIKGLLITLGLLFFIVPGIYLAVRWMFAELYVIDKGMRPMEALRASSKLTSGHRWKLFLFGVVVTVLTIIGLPFLVVGAIAVSVIATFALISIYKNLQMSEVGETTSEETS